VIINRTKVSRGANVGAFAALIVMVAFVLNSPWVLIEQTSLVYGIVVLVLLLIGLLGSVLRIRLAWAVGWLGIVGFLPAVLFAMPDLDHADPALNGFPTLWRLVTTALLFVALVLSFWLLTPRRLDK